MDALSPKLRPSAVLTALKNLPTEIDSTYDQAMERIQNLPPDHREMAMCFLSWIAFTDRALTAPEIEHATETYLMVQNDDGETFAIDVDNIISASELSSMCAGMVIVEGGNALLVHYTAVTYLDNFREKWFPGAYAILARTCLTYLLFDAFDAGACTGKTEDIDFEQRQAHGNTTVVECLLSRDDLCPNLRSDKSALMFAAMENQLDIVVLLLKDPRVSIDGQDDFGETALMLAASHGHTTVVEKSLDAGADANITDEIEDGGGTPLLRAIDYNRLPVVRAFLKRNVNYSSKDKYDRNLLHGAAINGRDTILQLLLEQTHDLDINEQDKDGRVPLHDR